jgi:hypothetical protein
MKKPLLITSVAVLVAFVVLWLFAPPAYRQAKERRSVAQTRRFLERGDFRNASLSARRTLQLNSRNLEACRALADLAERAHSPNALDWRRRIVELAPSIENKLALASTALRTQGPPFLLAAQTLQDLTPEAQWLPAYHVMAAELALKLHDFSEARRQFEEAGRLEPGNELHRVNLAVLLLQSTNSAEIAGARATLENLCSDTNLAVVALRWLVVDSLKNAQLSQAERFSKQLLNDPRADFDDYLQHLTILQQANSASFDSYLSAVQVQSITNAPEVYALTLWMAGHGLAKEGLDWLTRSSAAVQRQQPVPLAITECYIAKKDWSALDIYLQTGAWGDLEFLRKAFFSHSASEQNQKQASDTRWRAAVRDAGDRLGSLLMLLRLANGWGQDNYREDLLWQIARRFPGERWARLELSHLYQTTGNTRGLNKLAAFLAEANASDFEAQNNVAATLLLLNLDLPRATQLAREIYEQHGEQPIVASTYAFSLFVQGRTSDALDVFKSFKIEDLENPSIALYYGIFLNAAGETNKAAKFLQIARERVTSFLPEERALIAKIERP